MLQAPRRATLPAVLLILTVISGCGSDGHSTAAPAVSVTPGATSTPAATTTTGSPAGTLAADARSAATGDIPDNQVFLAYSSRVAGFSMLYPEGWTEASSGSHQQTTFQDKNNLVRVTIKPGSAPTPASVTAELTALKRADPTLSFRQATMLSLPGGSAVKAVYTTESAPNPVTGRRVKLIVDRYVLAGGGRAAVVDLGTPVGVDNVDAYRKMIESFRWR